MRNDRGTNVHGARVKEAGAARLERTIRGTVLPLFFRFFPSHRTQDACVPPSASGALCHPGPDRRHGTASPATGTGCSVIAPWTAAYSAARGTRRCGSLGCGLGRGSSAHGVRRGNGIEGWKLHTKTPNSKLIRDTPNVSLLRAQRPSVPLLHT